MSFDRIARLVLGVLGLAGARSFRGAGYNALRISRALQAKPKKHVQKNYPQNRAAQAPESQDEMSSIISWLNENAMGRLSPKQRGFVKNANAISESGRKLSPKQEQWLKSLYASHSQGENE